MKRVLAHIGVLQYLRTLSSRDQKQLVANAPRQLLFTLSEIALNIIARNISLSTAQISKLRKHEKQIVNLSQKKISLVKRKQILKGGSFLKNFLDTTLPSLILTLTKKSKKN